MNYQQSNYLIDVIMPAVKPTTYKVVCLIARKTWGWRQRPEAELSFSEITKLTGITSINTIKEAIKEAGDFIEQLSIEDGQGYKYKMRPIKEAEAVSDFDTPDEETISDFDIVPEETVSKFDIVPPVTVSEIDTVPCQILIELPPVLNKGKEEDKEKEEERVLSANADYQAVRQRYVELFPAKPKPRADNGTLAGKVKTRMKSTHFRENWEAALSRVALSHFAKTEGWFHLGWFLHNDENYEKCLNGNYDDRPQVYQNGTGAKNATHQRNNGKNYPDFQPVSDADLEWWKSVNADPAGANST